MHLLHVQQKGKEEKLTHATHARRREKSDTTREAEALISSCLPSSPPSTHCTYSTHRQTCHPPQCLNHTRLLLPPCPPRPPTHSSTVTAWKEHSGESQQKENIGHDIDPSPTATSPSRAMRNPPLIALPPGMADAPPPRSSSWTWARLLALFTLLLVGGINLLLFSRHGSTTTTTVSVGTSGGGSILMVRKEG